MGKLSGNVIDLSSDFSVLKDDFSEISDNIDEVGSDLNDLSANYTKLSGTINGLPTNIPAFSSTNKAINSIGKSTNTMNKKLDATGASSKKAESGLGKLLKSALSFENIKKGFSAIDQYINASNSLARVNDGLQSQVELQNKVNAAATRSFISYKDMASAVSSIGKLDIFGSNDEAIAFTELMQKSLKMEGSSQSLGDISNAMSDNVIAGDEFTSLTGGAPIIKETLLSYTGKSGEELKAMADQGLITAELLKNAMFTASSDINSKFAEQPKTFADIWTQIKDTAMNALNPLMELVSKIINSDEFQGALSIISSALGFVSQVATSLVNFIMDNGDTILSLLIAVGAVLLGVLAASAVSWFIAYLPILLIIGAIMIVIHVLTQMGVSFQDILSFIGGIIGTFVAHVYNIFAYLWNYIAAFVNFFANVFTDPIAAIKTLFYDLVVNVLGFIEKIAKGIETLINKIPGIEVDLTSNITNLKDKFAEESANIKSEANFKEYVKTLDYMDYSEAASKGSEIGSNIYSTITDATGSITDGLVPDMSQFAASNDLGTQSDPVVTEGTGSGGSVKVDMEDEDLSYLREMAERDYIANIATNTLAPNISVSFGDVHETADVNELFGRIQTILKEQIAIAPEGVY
jgi:tape measure domain-containing protein